MKTTICIAFTFILGIVLGVTLRSPESDGEFDQTFNMPAAINSPPRNTHPSDFRPNHSSQKVLTDFSTTKKEPANELTVRVALQVVKIEIAGAKIVPEFATSLERMDHVRNEFGCEKESPPPLQNHIVGDQLRHHEHLTRTNSRSGQVSLRPEMAEKVDRSAFPRMTNHHSPHPKQCQPPPICVQQCPQRCR